MALTNLKDVTDYLKSLNNINFAFIESFVEDLITGKLI